MSETRDKEVYFDKYCATCKHNKVSEESDPCWDCLGYPCNTDSHKPVNWEEG